MFCERRDLTPCLLVGVRSLGKLGMTNRLLTPSRSLSKFVITMTYNKTFKISTKGICDIIDITDKVTGIVNQSKIKDGVAIIFVTGSTAAITTLEMNANLEQDLCEALELMAPQNKKYHHDAKWGDGNGFSHVRASIMGSSESVPIIKGQMQLGTWQQIVLCDFDNKSRQREVLVQIIGE